MYCENCGFSIADDATTCDICGHPISSSQASKKSATNTQNNTTDYNNINFDNQYYSHTSPSFETEHPLLGFIGALIGALIGGASIILFSRIGIVAALSGIILTFCTVKGYELLGKTLTKRGIVISVILIIITPYLANHFDWALLIYETYIESDMDITLGESISLVNDFIELGLIEKGAYLKELYMIYLFALLGSISIIKDAFNL